MSGVSLLLPLVAADEYGSVCRPVRTGLLALGRLAPRCHRVAAARGTAFAAAVRMVDRVHHNAAVMRLAPEPAITAGLADRNIHVVRIGHCTDGRRAPAVNQTLLAGIQADDHVILVAADDLRIGAGRARELTALADFQFDIVDDGAD